MTTEINVKTVEKEKKRMEDAISGGIFLISLGILLFTGWWWPGIMIAIGISSGASLIYRGKIWQGIGSLIFFCGIAVAVEFIRTIDVSGVTIGAFILIGIGVIILVKVLFIQRRIVEI